MKSCECGGEECGEECGCEECCEVENCLKNGSNERQCHPFFNFSWTFSWPLSGFPGPYIYPWPLFLALVHFSWSTFLRPCPLFLDLFPGPRRSGGAVTWSFFPSCQSITGRSTLLFSEIFFPPI